MRGRGISVRWGRALLGVCIVALGAACFGQEPPFECFGVTDLERVFEDGYKCPAPQKRMEVFGIRNEVLSAQCAVKARQALRDLTVSIGPLKLKNSTGSMPAEAVTWNFVGSIQLAQNSPNHRKEGFTRAAPARFPDYLAEAKKMSLDAGCYQGIYLTIRVPKDAQAGDYEGLVTLRAEKSERTLPLVVTVFPLTLPDERHLMVTEWFSTGRFKQFHGVDSSNPDAYYKMLAVYANNMADHRQNVFRVSPDLITATRRSDGKLTFDFSRFDRWCEVFWSTGRMSLLETGFVARFREGGWSSKEIVLRDFPVRDEAKAGTITMPGQEFLPQFLPALEEHLQERGWLDKTVFHIADEPSNHNIMTWREASEFVHRYGPRLRRMDAIETPHCRDRLEVWVPKLDHYATWQEAYDEAQRRGNEMWFYTVGIFQAGTYMNKTADVPLIQSRTMHWLNYRFGLTGYLHWGYNMWTDDPFEAPGQHCGDGWHVYPTKGGLLDSLRWEQMRNGIQDYEYFRLLEEKMSQMKKGMSQRVAALLDPRQRGVEIAARVVGTADDYSNDPNTLYAARRQIIDDMLGLEQAPRLIVQTNPIERSRVAAGAAIDVHGWAEPGTQVTINGTAVPVADDGLFLENVPLSSRRTITVEARNQKEKRQFVRRFQPLLRD